MIQVFLDDFEIDIIQPSINQTFQANSLGEVENRQASFTNRFKAPFTPKNVKFFKGLSVAGIASDRGRVNYSARITENSIELVSEGFGQVRETDRFYLIVVYSGIKTLYERTQDKSIRDLNLSEHTHQLTIENLLKKNNFYTYTNSYLGNIISSTYELEKMLPFVYDKTIFDAIFRDAGLTYEGFNLGKTVVAPTNGYLPDFSNSTRLTSEVLNRNQTVTLYPPDVPGTIEEDVHVFNIPKRGYYKISIAGTDNFKASISSSNQYDYFTSHSFWINGSGIAERISTDAAIDFEKVYYFEEAGQIRLTESTIANRISGSDEYVQVAFRYNHNLSLSLSFVSDPITVSLNDILPDISQKQYVKEIAWRYGLVFGFKNNAHYEIKRMEDVFADRPNAKDWSKKFSSVIKRKYNLPYAQTNHFKYKEHEEYDGFGDSFFDIDNETYNEDKTLIQSAFRVDEKINNYNVFQVPIYGKDDDGNTTVEETDPRIFTEGDAKTINVRLYGRGIASVEVAQLDQEPILWSKLLEDNYQALRRVIQEAHILTAKINLNTLDIAALDFLKLIYIKQEGSYFYLNKIQNYRKNKLTKCELIKVPANILASAYSQYSYEYYGYYGGESSGIGTL